MLKNKFLSMFKKPVPEKFQSSKTAFFGSAPRPRRKKGVTIIELIIIMTLVAVLAAVSSLYIKETVDLWNFLIFRNEMVSQGRMAFSRMVREIRHVKDRNSVLTAQAERFRFYDVNDNEIDFYLSDDILMRNSDILAGGVNSLEFTYYDNTNTVISTPAVSPFMTDIYRIVIILGIGSGSQSKTLQVAVYPRNL